MGQRFQIRHESRKITDREFVHQAFWHDRCFQRLADFDVIFADCVFLGLRVAKSDLIGLFSRDKSDHHSTINGEYRGGCESLRNGFVRLQDSFCQLLPFVGCSDVAQIRALLLFLFAHSVAGNAVGFFEDAFSVRPRRW